MAGTKVKLKVTQGKSTVSPTGLILFYSISLAAILHYYAAAQGELSDDAV